MVGVDEVGVALEEAGAVTVVVAVAVGVGAGDEQADRSSAAPARATVDRIRLIRRRSVADALAAGTAGT
ncbi:hypothetical protein GCM10009869_03320 [Amnibacterium kyonggiense]